jgi:hypothetical protein
MQSSPENQVENNTGQTPDESQSKSPLAEQPNVANHQIRREIGGRPGPDPTRYGDWEKDGRCIDF